MFGPEKPEHACTRVRASHLALVTCQVTSIRITSWIRTISSDLVPSHSVTLKQVARRALSAQVLRGRGEDARRHHSQSVNTAGTYTQIYNCLRRVNKIFVCFEPAMASKSPAPPESKGDRSMRSSPHLYASDFSRLSWRLLMGTGTHKTWHADAGDKFQAERESG